VGKIATNQQERDFREGTRVTFGGPAQSIRRSTGNQIPDPAEDSQALSDLYELIERLKGNFLEKRTLHLYGGMFPRLADNRDDFTATGYPQNPNTTMVHLVGFIPDSPASFIEDDSQKDIGYKVEGFKSKHVIDSFMSHWVLSSGEHVLTEVRRNIDVALTTNVKKLQKMQLTPQIFQSVFTVIMILD